LFGHKVELTDIKNNKICYINPWEYRLNLLNYLELIFKFTTY
jgi:hypothetical protein